MCVLQTSYKNLHQADHFYMACWSFSLKLVGNICNPHYLKYIYKIHFAYGLLFSFQVNHISFLPVLLR